MKTTVIQRADGDVICTAQIADSMMTRGVGLLSKKSLPEEEGLLIKPCTSVHTFFMRFPIDILCLDKTNTVVKGVRMKPNRFSFGGKGSKTVLELPYNSIEKYEIQVGEQLTLA